MRRPHPRSLRLLVAATSLLVLVSCAADGAPTPAEEESGSTAPESSSSATPAVTAADGPEVRTKRFRVHMPRGWRTGAATSTFAAGAYSPGPDPGEIMVSHLPQLGSSSLSSLARQYRFGADPSLRRVEDAELGGQPAVHLVGEDGSVHVDLFAVVKNGEAVDIQFSTAPGRKAEAGREELIASVLASWEWR